MAIEVQDLTTLDPALVTQFDAELTTMVQEANPTLELRSGVLHDLLIHVKAQLDAATQTNIDRIRQSSSLKQINVDPTLADTGVVDNVLSNYNLTRNPGAKATGTIAIVLDQLIGVVIPRGAVFTANGIDFAPTQTYAARTSASALVTPQDVLITAVDTTTFSFDLPVSAVAIGINGNIDRGVEVTPDSAPPHFVKAYAKSDFGGGADADTNATLLAKQEAGLAVQAWSNRPSIEKLLRAVTDFANIQAISIVGYGDAEMKRDQHSLWPGSMGGRSDLYLKSQPLYQSKTVTKTATLVSKSGVLGTWQIGLSISDAPGFYAVTGVLLPTQDQTLAGTPVTSDVRFIDNASPPSDVLLPPDIETVDEGCYSRYQAAVIQFEDGLTDATSFAIGAQQDYNVILQVLPLIAEVQDFLSDREHRPPMCDVLVRAPIPCFTTVGFSINYDKNTPTPDVVPIKLAVSEAVNALGFAGSLPRSLIDKVLHANVPNMVSVTDYELDGAIRYPPGDGSTIVAISDTDTLDIPYDPANMVTSRTVVFYLRPEDVLISLLPVDTPDV